MLNWNKITNILSFTGVEDKSVWQDLFFSILAIPLALIILNKIIIWWSKNRPTNLLFKEFIKNKKKIFIFHSQMSGADDNWNFNPNQKYITKFPKPLPTNQSNLGIQKKLNIDPIISQAETECLSDVYNILGEVKKVKNIFLADLINDWNVWSSPIFTIGFNPKTDKLIKKCEPIHFELNHNELKIKNTDYKYSSILPNDVGVIQKTFIKDSGSPIFILAGLGTLGTSSAGYVFKKHFVKLGKLFGNKSFCVFLKVNTDEGKTSAIVDKIYPSPNWFRKILFPVTYYKYKKKNIFG